MKKSTLFFKPSRQNRKASALVFFYLGLAGFLLILGSFAIRGSVESQMTRRSQDELQAYYLAEAGIDQVKRGLYDAFRANFSNIISANFAWFDDLPNSAKYTLPNNASLSTVPGGTYSVDITNVDNPVDQDRDITLASG